MKEHPILFSTEMIKAILKGRKTMTRRISKDNGDTLIGYEHVTNSPTYPEFWKGKKSEPYTGWVAKFNNLPIAMPRSCPYGQPGELLWVRETWRWVEGALGSGVYDFKADGNYFGDIKFKQSIHMPKEASRIWLEVINTKVERVQNIIEADAIAEGVEPNCSGNTDSCPSIHCKNNGCQAEGEYFHYTRSLDDFPAYGAIESYQSLWEKINGVDSWELNPYVWVIEFKILSTIGKPNQ